MYRLYLSTDISSNNNKSINISGNKQFQFSLREQSSKFKNNLGVKITDKRKMLNILYKSKDYFENNKILDYLNTENINLNSNFEKISQSNSQSKIYKEYNKHNHDQLRSTNRIYNNSCFDNHQLKKIETEEKKKKFEHFEFNEIPRMTIKVRSKNSEIMRPNLARKYYKTLESSIRAGEKKFDYYLPDKNQKLLDMCENQDKKIKNILNDVIVNRIKLPALINPSFLNVQINSYSNPNGNNKHMGERYDPNEHFYPHHTTSGRNDLGIPFTH